MSRPTRHEPAGIPVTRRRFVMGASSALALSCLPQAQGVWASARPTPPPVLSGREFDLVIGEQSVNVTGRERRAVTVNNSLPAPLLRWREGDRVRLKVHNSLDETSSIHWHGLILPSNMDGVPGMSFDGIQPGETFSYEFDVQQSGTYWYHSHSGYQEQRGLYGAIIIDPKDADPVSYDREHVLVLSDWTDDDPADVHARLKKESHYYNFRRRTIGDFFSSVRERGFAETLKQREMWNEMRMSATDISDVTGHTYTFLMNGVSPGRGWEGRFRPGEKVRLRIINAAAMTLFDFRIPGLKMSVVAADGQNIQPVAVDEFRIGPAETYDVIVEPETEGAYTLFAQAIDRSGFARGTLASREGLAAEIPEMDGAPTLGHADMGMAHGEHGAHSPDNSGMDSTAMDHSSMDHSEMSHSEMGHSEMGHSEMGHSRMDHSGTDRSKMAHSDVNHSEMNHGAMAQHAMHGSAAAMKSEPAQGGDHKAGMAALGLAGFGSTSEIHHSESEYGPQVDMRAKMPKSGLHDPGVGLREHDKLGRRVLRYADIKGLHPTRDKRQPTREIQLHLTGNMHRYLWSMDGIPFADAEPLELEYGERVRIQLVNDTMMTHPIHLHGVWSELETGDPEYIPRKHTILVQPGSTISYLVTADARGRWAYHCHLLLHMGGMMREVRIS